MAIKENLASRCLEWKIRNVSRENIETYPSITSVTMTMRINDQNEYFLIELEYCEFFSLRIFNEETSQEFSYVASVTLGEEKKKVANTSERDRGVYIGFENFVTLDDFLKQADENNCVTLIVKLKLASYTDVFVFPPMPEQLQEFDTQSFSDFKIVCLDQKEIPAHRFMVARSSSFFRKIFDQRREERCFVHYDSYTMNELLRYMYTGQYQFGNLQFNTKMLVAATVFDVPKLRLIFVEKLKKEIDEKNVIQIVEMCSGEPYVEILERCYSVIANSFDFFFNNGEIDEMPPGIGTNVLNSLQASLYNVSMVSEYGFDEDSYSSFLPS